jgi:DNA topoisomerase-1
MSAMAETNATLPEGTEPDTVTMEQALALIAERAAKGGGKKKKAAKAPKAKAAPKLPRKRRLRPKNRPKPQAKRRLPPLRQSSGSGQKSQEPEMAGE